MQLTQHQRWMEKKKLTLNVRKTGLLVFLSSSFKEYTRTSTTVREIHAHTQISLYPFHIFRFSYKYGTHYSQHSPCCSGVYNCLLVWIKRKPLWRMTGILMSLVKELDMACRWRWVTFFSMFGKIWGQRVNHIKTEMLGNTKKCFIWCYNILHVVLNCKTSKTYNNISNI